MPCFSILRKLLGPKSHQFNGTMRVYSDLEFCV